MPALSALFGQSSAIATIRRTIAADTLPGTYLFTGAAGMGKGALARATAQTVMCLQLAHDPVDACGVCESCRRFGAGTHPEVVTFLPAGEQTQIFQFWERENRPQSGILTRTLNYAPMIGRRRVYIIERAETLTESAANSLLKVLEEPPSYVLFILLAPNPASVLPTIVSRSQMVRLVPAARTDLEVYLHKTLGVESERAALYAALAEGKTGQAVRLAQTPKVGEEIARVLDFAETIPEAPPLRALKLAEQMRKLATQMKVLIGEESADAGSSDDSDAAPSARDRASRRQLAVVFDLLVVFYRDLMALSVCSQSNSSGSSSVAIMNRGRTAELNELATGSQTERWMRCLDSLMMARRRLDANASVALVTDVLAMSLVD